MTIDSDTDTDNCVLCGNPRAEIEEVIRGKRGWICLNCAESCRQIVSLHGDPTRKDRIDALTPGVAPYGPPTTGQVDLIDHIDQLKSDLDNLAVYGPTLQAIADAVLSSIRSGGKLLTCGNGGSAAEAAHLAEELTGRFYRERDSLPGLCLSIDGTLLTCIANDYGFEEIFARQVASLGRPGDVFAGFTTSGNSENVRRALVKASEIGLVTVLFSGRTGGKSKGLADYEIIVESTHPSSMRIQECHQLLLHVLCEMIETEHLGITPGGAAE